MMSADELFKHEGYECKDIYGTRYYGCYDLSFHEDEQMLWIDGADEFHMICLDAKEIKAIYQKVKELGWLDDD